jgi:hypothetical protein
MRPDNHFLSPFNEMVWVEKMQTMSSSQERIQISEESVNYVISVSGGQEDVTERRCRRGP